MSEACRRVQSTIRNLRIVQCDPSVTPRLRADVAQKLAEERLKEFNANRLGAKAVAAEKVDIAQLGEMKKIAKKDRTKAGEDA